MDLTMKIEQMQEQNADVFAIPDYFVYMSRAFSTLEGLGLSSDSNYSTLKECYPYLAKRLLSDDSPRARGALRTLLYGSSSDKGDELLDLSKLQELSVGLESYTTSTSSVESSKGGERRGSQCGIGTDCRRSSERGWELRAGVALARDSSGIGCQCEGCFDFAIDVVVANWKFVEYGD